MKVRSLFSLLVLSSIFASALYVSSRARGAQPPFQGRTVKRLPVERNEPVRIRAVKVKGLKVIHGQTFLADEEWLRGLTITITNRTTKTIVFASIDIRFPRPGNSDAPIAIDMLEYGNRTLLTQKLPVAERLPRIVPNQTVDLVLSARGFDRLGSLLTTTGYHSGGPEKLELSVGHIIFDDDTAWYAGAPHQRDLNDPRTWLNVEQSSAKRKSNGLDSVVGTSQPKSNSTLLKIGLADRFASSFDSSSRLTNLLSTPSFISQPSVACYAELSRSYPGCGTFGWCGAECRYFQDSLTTSSGNYFLGAGDALCTRAACLNESGEINCNTWRGTTAKNTCYGGADGGHEGGGTSCYDDWDCDFGYYCNEFSQCEEHLDD